MPAKKRKAAQISQAPATPAPTGQARPVFFITAGAGGSLPKDKNGEAPVNLNTLLSTLGDTTGPGVEGPTFTGGAGVTEKVLTGVEAQLLAACARYPDRPVFLVGQSFGSRVSLHYFLGQAEDRKNESGLKTWTRKQGVPAQVKGAICCGYPLFHKAADNAARRHAVFSELPPGTHALFLSGDNDKEGLGAATTGKGANLQLLKTAISDSKANLQLHIVTKGKHNPFDVPKTKRAGTNEEALSAIRQWVSARAAAPTESRSAKKKRTKGPYEPQEEEDISGLAEGSVEQLQAILKNLHVRRKNMDNDEKSTNEQTIEIAKLVKHATIQLNKKKKQLKALEDGRQGDDEDEELGLE